MSLQTSCGAAIVVPSPVAEAWPNTRRRSTPTRHPPREPSRFVSTPRHGCPEADRTTGGNAALLLALGGPTLRVLERYRRRFAWEPWAEDGAPTPDLAAPSERPPTADRPRPTVGAAGSLREPSPIEPALTGGQMMGQRRPHRSPDPDGGVIALPTVPAWLGRSFVPSAERRWATNRGTVCTYTPLRGDQNRR